MHDLNKPIEGSSANKALHFTLLAAVEQWKSNLCLSALGSGATNLGKKRKRQKNVKYAKGILHLLCNKYSVASKAYLLRNILLGTAGIESQLTDTGYKYIVFLLLRSRFIHLEGNNELDAVAAAMKSLAEAYFRKRYYVEAADVLGFTMEELISKSQSHEHCALLFSNRAACYLQLKHFDRCILDCTAGLLELDKSIDSQDLHSHKITRVKLYVRRSAAIIDLLLSGNDSKIIVSQKHYTVKDAIGDHDAALTSLNSFDDDVLRSLLPMLLDLNKVNTLCKSFSLKLKADRLFRNLSNESVGIDKYDMNDKIIKVHEMYSSILRDTPTYISVLNNRASASLVLGMFEDTLQDTTRALQLLKYEDNDSPGVAVETKIKSRKEIIVGPCPSKTSDEPMYKSWVVKILAKRGAAYVQLGEYQQAFNDLSNAVALDDTGDVKLKHDMERIAEKVQSGV